MPNINIRDRFNKTISNSSGEGLMRWRYDIACDECKRQADQHDHPQLWLAEYMKECERCAVLEFLEDAVFGLYLTIREARQAGRFRDRTTARAKTPMEALERGLAEWYSADVLDCGHKGWVRLEDARCSSCYAAEVVKERKARTAKPAKPPVAPRLTPEQIAEIEARKEAERKEAQAERQRRSRANRRKLKSLQAPVTDNI